MISSEKEAEILRLFRAEAMRGPCTLARVVGVHPDAVRRVLTSAGLAESGTADALAPSGRESILDPYAPLIDTTLRKYPNICASRIFGMLCERGYTGVSQGHVRRFVNARRPEAPTEAFLRLALLPGEQAQVDWAHFGPAGERYPGRKLSAFVMTLAYSRHLYFRFFLSMRMREFLQGFVEGFEFFGGVPRGILIDNLKSGVTERVGDVVRFNRHFLDLATHYAFEPHAAGVRRGNEKGRVERSIRYVRDSFFTARTYESLADLNEQARKWCEGIAAMRPWRDDRSLEVHEAFAQERPRLLALPGNPFPCVERVLAKVGKQPYVWFDANEYSVPHELSGKQVEIVAVENKVAVHGPEDALPVAVHERSYGRHAVIENPEHVEALRRAKPGGARSSGLRPVSRGRPVVVAHRARPPHGPACPLRRLSPRSPRLVGLVTQAWSS